MSPAPHLLPIKPVLGSSLKKKEAVLGGAAPGTPDGAVFAVGVKGFSAAL